MGYACKYLIKNEKDQLLMQSKTNKIKELKYDYYDEISIGDLIFEIDNSDEINLYTIKENTNNNNVLEKNILIYLKKNRQLD